MDHSTARKKAPLAFTRRYGPSMMPLDVSIEQIPEHGTLIVVYDPEDNHRVGYAFRNRQKLLQVMGPRERG